MTTPLYPADLPGVSTLTWTTVPQVIATEGEIGAKANRRRSQVPAAIAEVSWRFMEGDFALFQTFYKTTLLRGHKWFSIVLPCGAGYAAHVVRFISHRAAPRPGYGYREVTAQLEIRERRLRPNTFYTYTTTTPYPLYVPEALASSLTVLSGTFGTLLALLDTVEGLDPTLVPLSGELRVALIEYLEAEGLESELEILSGTLRDALITYDLYEPEGVNSLLGLVGGTLRAALIANSIPPESLDPTLTVLSGTLV
jgi:hypothetical protein